MILSRHPINQGYGAVLMTGFGNARRELLGFLDADGTNPPERFPDLCRVAMLENADLVIGSRMSGTECEIPFVRCIGNLVFASLVSLLGSRHLTESASGMRVIRREALASLYPLPDGLNFTPVMSTRAVHLALIHIAARHPGFSFFFDVVEHGWFRAGTQWEQIDMDRSTVLDYPHLRAEELERWASRAFRE